jgi:rare lipoprotein A
VSSTDNRIVGAQPEGRATFSLLELARRPGYFLSLFAVCATCVCFLCGCGSRRTIADRPEPPEAGSADTTENAEAPRTPERAGDPGAKAPRSVPGGSAKRGGAAATPNPALSAYTEEGIASWYGIPFHGRRASNGEVYDMNKLTAAHRTLPFETVVRVTNLSNGKVTVVRITDRGPFVDNRIIDLSMAAAREIDSVGAGVVPVRLEIISAGIDPGSGFFTVQVGAFRERGNAERLRERLTDSYSPIFIQPYDSPDGLFYRVRVGKVPGEPAAQQFGEKLRNREGFRPMVVRLDEGAGGGRNE